MIKIKCPICGIDSYIKSTSQTMMQLNRGSIAELQFGDWVRAISESGRDDPSAPYVEVEVIGISRKEE